MPAGTQDYYATSRRRADRHRRGDQEGVSPQGARAASRREPGARTPRSASRRSTRPTTCCRTPQKREQYDRFGTVGTRPRQGGPAAATSTSTSSDLFGGGGGGGFDMEDLFSAFFGGVTGGSGGGVRLEGRDMAMSVVDHARRGRSRRREGDRARPPRAVRRVRRHRRGAGQLGRDVPRLRRHRPARHRAQDLPRHDADGRPRASAAARRAQVVENPCEECQGTGRVPDRQHVNVTIPAGIRDGQQIRLRGLGEAGIRGAAAGDLLVTVRIKPDEYLHREGDDLHCRATVSMTQAALGADLNVCGRARGQRGPRSRRHPARRHRAGEGPGHAAPAAAVAGDLIVHLARRRCPRSSPSGSASSSRSSPTSSATSTRSTRRRCRSSRTGSAGSCDGAPLLPHRSAAGGAGSAAAALAGGRAPCGARAARARRASEIEVVEPGGGVLVAEVVSADEAGVVASVLGTRRRRGLRPAARDAVPGRRQGRQDGRHRAPGRRGRRRGGRPGHDARARSCGSTPPSGQRAASAGGASRSPPPSRPSAPRCRQSPSPSTFAEAARAARRLRPRRSCCGRSARRRSRRGARAASRPRRRARRRSSSAPRAG